MGDGRTVFPKEVEPTPETAHVLFADIVGYSRLASDEQPRVVQQLRQAVHNSSDFKKARQASSLICIPTGDGMALVFLDSDICAPIRAAMEISDAFRNAQIGLRMGIHTGAVFRVQDINGADTVAGAGINVAQRVMDCGDAGHILVSEVHASFLQEIENLRAHLHELGETEVKHGVRLRLINFSDGSHGNPQRPGKFGPSEEASPAPSNAVADARVAIIYKRNADPDEALLRALESELKNRGCEVFVDRHLRVGLEWAHEIEQALRGADAVIPLLSPASVASEMLVFELEIANEAAQQQGGRPQLLPVRVNWEGPLPASINQILDPIQYTLWRGPEDSRSVFDELLAALGAGPKTSPSPSRVVEPPGGAMPLDSAYYIERAGDADCREAIARRDSLLLIHGARQMGKTSLLSRSLQCGRQGGARVACTDFQKLNASDLTSLESFYLTLGTALASQLDIEKYPEDTWRAKSGPNENFERFVRREVLDRIGAPLVWGLDEVDRLFTCSFGSEVFGLFRAWHNARALDPESPWRKLSLVICYATEAHLFISDLNQSPFNVGTRVRLDDFNATEIRRLNQLYGEPLRGPEELERFANLLGGQPYLVRRGLHEMVSRQQSLAELERVAPSDEGPFSDHLKRFLVLLSRDEEVMHAVRALLESRQPPEQKLFYRLRAAGLIRGAVPGDARFRCGLYEAFFRRHLL